MEWLQVSLPALCPQGTTRTQWELYAESSSEKPLSISQFPPSPFAFSLLQALPLSKTNVGMLCSQNSWERSKIFFASFAFRAGSQWCLGGWCTMVSPMLLQLSSTGTFQTVLSCFHPSAPKLLFSKPSARVWGPSMCCRCAACLLPPATAVPCRADTYEVYGC